MRSKRGFTPPLREPWPLTPRPLVLPWPADAPFHFDDDAHLVVPPGLDEHRTQLAQQRLLSALRRSGLLSRISTTWSAGRSTISSFVMLPALPRPGPDGQ